MSFKISARTILQLGAELISSDAIAFYELIKNAFDASSPDIRVNVELHFSHDFLQDFLSQLKTLKDKQENVKKGTADLSELKTQLLSNFRYVSEESNEIAAKINQARNPAQLYDVIEKSNYIDFIDTGDGMKLRDLNDVYLTIGTRNRHTQKLENADLNIKKPVLGEKGLGRLSVMRLGDGLIVKTTVAGEKNYNILEIDWRRFSHDSDSLIQDILIEPVKGSVKKDESASGTTIRIYNLKAQWSLEKLESMAREELAKLIDPFSRKTRIKIRIKFNGEKVVIPNLEKILFENAHAYVEAKLETSGESPKLSGYIDYRLYNKQKQFSIESPEIFSIAKAKENPELIRKLGPFSMSFHWFNRRILEAIDGIGNQVEVRKYVHRWANGLMVYRDGFRVYPYGGPDDDWLELDKKALGAQGYKVNRRQIIGKVDIHLAENPALLDQTNREGIRDSPEKSILINLLKNIMWQQFKAFLNKVDSDRLTGSPIDIGLLENRLNANEQKLEDNLKLLIQKYPKINTEHQILTSIRDTFGRTRRIFSEAKIAIDSYKQKQDITLHLAGLGQMVDIVAHELNRSTQHAMETLETFDEAELSSRLNSLIKTLKLQLKTLQSRLKILDPLSPSGRNQKKTFDLVELIQEVMQSHEAQFSRHGILAKIEKDFSGPWKIKAVDGMFIQVIENCIVNSVYWLEFQKKLQKSFKPSFVIRLEKKLSRILISDNGPGVPVNISEDVFLPFYTSKPPFEGKGLGLYIAKEIAKYHNADLSLSSFGKIHPDRLNTFQLDISNLV